ncbi:MAG: hypothetical protein ABIO70_23765 [Pseudomonadota bacterium]
MHELCFASTACRRALYDAFLGVMARVDTLDLPALVHQSRDLVGERVLTESSAHGDPEVTRAAWDQVDLYMAERHDQLAAWLGCLAGEVVDHDQDGWDGGTEDLDERDADIGPGER